MHLTFRQQQIMNLLQQYGQISVDELCESLFFSPSTIRRELEILQQYELLHRTHGGAAIRAAWSAGIPVLIRETLETEVKRKLAEAAAKHINDGDCIFLDSSSTVLPIADYLSDFSDLTIFTNGLQLANRLLEYPKIKAICTGGQLVTASQSFVGSQVNRFLDFYYADKLFFSSNSFSPDGGISDVSEYETESKRKMIQRSSKSFYLADATKINSRATYKVCDLSEIDTLITNADRELFPAESLPFSFELVK